MGTIRQCTDCGNYTLQPKCPSCGAPSRDPTPPKYSPEDRWGHLRRRAKLEHAAREAARK